MPKKLPNPQRGGPLAERPGPPRDLRVFLAPFARIAPLVFLALLVMLPRGVSGIGDKKKEAPTEKKLTGQELELAKRRARAVREAVRKRRLEYRKALDLFLEEKRRRDKLERLKRIKREDPEHNTFWRREMTAKLGRQIIITVPSDRRAVLFRQRNPLQFQGYRGHMHRFNPKLFSGRAMRRDRSDMTKFLLSRRGHQVVLLLPFQPDPAPDRKSRTSDRKEDVSDLKTTKGRRIFADLKRGDFELPKTTINGDHYEIINIYSDGVDILLVEAELMSRGGEAGEYFRWAVDRVYLDQR